MEELNINYEVYLDGKRLLGIAQVTQPNLQSMTQEMKGAGIAGSVDTVVLGHFQDMTGTISFRTVTSDVKKILVQQYHHLEFWAAVQTSDPATGKKIPKQHKIIWRAMPKANNIGTIAVGELQNRELEFSLTYLKELYDNDLVLELDKLNYIYKVGGEDLLSGVRSILGL
jgi:P2 family phage contractile tail tube protein